MKIRLPLPPLSLGTLLLLLALVSTMPLAGALLYSALEIRRSTEAAALSGLRVTLVRAADEFRSSLLKSRQLVAFLALDPTLADGGSVACAERLGRLFTELAGYSNIYVLDPRGGLVCSARPAPVRLAPADADQLRLALDWERPRIGGPLPGPIYGRHVVPVAAALRDADGVARGVVAVTLDLAATLVELRARHGSPGLAVALWRDDGTVLAREPNGHPEYALLPYAQTLLGALKEAAERSATLEAVDLDGSERIHGISRLDLDEQRLWLSVSLATGPLYGQVDGVFRRSLVGALLVTVLCLILAKLVCAGAVGRPLERIRRGIRELREGRGPATLDAFRGVKELRELVLEVEALAERPPCLGLPGCVRCRPAPQERPATIVGPGAAT